jgi:hypothetical protein
VDKRGIADYWVMIIIILVSVILLLVALKDKIFPLINLG